MNDERNESGYASTAGSYQEDTVRRGYEPSADPLAGGHAGTPVGASIPDRLKAVLRIEHGIFHEVAADPASTKQALIVVAAASAIGSWYSFVWVVLVVPFKCIGVAIAAGICSLTARLFSDRVPPYENWFRAFGFAAAPMAAGAIPLLGDFAGWIYQSVLQVVAIRELSRISTGAAAMAWILAVLVPVIALTGAVIILGGFAALTAFVESLGLSR